MLTMKTIKILSLAIVLLLLPFVYHVQSSQNTSVPPPVEPTLVRQGDFAISLMEALALGPIVSETESQELLAEFGIAPKNGWISDYPVTPEIIGELQEAILEAVDQGSLSMNRDEAVNILHSIAADYGLPIFPDPDRTTYTQAPPSYGPYSYTDHYVEPTVVNNYYYRTGPPVFTYYTPPYAYYHLYSWVPYSFWWGGFWFSGYFMLNDFHRTSHVVVLRGYGPKRHFRSHKKIIGVVSNRSKKIHRTPKGTLVYPSRQGFGGFKHPSINKPDRHRSRIFEAGDKSRSPFIRRGFQEGTRYSGDKTFRNNDRFNRAVPSGPSEIKTGKRIRDKRPGVNEGFQSHRKRDTSINRPSGRNPLKFKKDNSQGFVNSRRNQVVEGNRRTPVTNENRPSSNRPSSGFRFSRGSDRNTFQQPAARSGQADSFQKTAPSSRQGSFQRPSQSGARTSFQRSINSGRQNSFQRPSGGGIGSANQGFRGNSRPRGIRSPGFSR